MTENHIQSEVADMLNRQGCRSWDGSMFSVKSVRYVIKTYGLRSRYSRLREKGYLTLREKIVELNSTKEEIMQMRNEGKIVFYRATERNEYLYEPQDMNKYLAKTQS